MSELLQKLTRSCFADRDALDSARTQAALWQTWLLPVTADTPVGEDPGYHDDFLRIRDEMNKLSGADTDLPCQLAEYPLLARAKRRGPRHLLHLGATAPRWRTRTG